MGTSVFDLCHLRTNQKKKKQPKLQNSSENATEAWITAVERFKKGHRVLVQIIEHYEVTTCLRRVRSSSHDVPHMQTMGSFILG